MPPGADEGKLRALLRNPKLWLGVSAGFIGSAIYFAAGSGVSGDSEGGGMFGGRSADPVASRSRLSEPGRSSLDLARGDLGSGGGAGGSGAGPFAARGVGAGSTEEGDGPGMSGLREPGAKGGGEGETPGEFLGALASERGPFGGPGAGERGEGPGEGKGLEAGGAAGRFRGAGPSGGGGGFSGPGGSGASSSASLNSAAPSASGSGQAATRAASSGPAGQTQQRDARAVIVSQAAGGRGSVGARAGTAKALAEGSNAAAGRFAASGSGGGYGAGAAVAAPGMSGGGAPGEIGGSQGGGSGGGGGGTTGVSDATGGGTAGDSRERPDVKAGPYVQATSEFQRQSILVDGRGCVYCLIKAYRVRFEQARGSIDSLTTSVGKGVAAFDQGQPAVAKILRELHDKALVGQDGFKPTMHQAVDRLIKGEVCYLLRDPTRFHNCHKDWEGIIGSVEQLTKQLEELGKLVVSEGEKAMKAIQGPQDVVDNAQVALAAEVNAYQILIDQAEAQLNGLRWGQEDLAMRLRPIFDQVKEPAQRRLGEVQKDKLGPEDQAKWERASAKASLSLGAAETAWGDLDKKATQQQRVVAFIEAVRETQLASIALAEGVKVLDGTEVPDLESVPNLPIEQCDLPQPPPPPGGGGDGGGKGDTWIVKTLKKGEEFAKKLITNPLGAGKDVVKAVDKGIKDVGNAVSDVGKKLGF